MKIEGLIYLLGGALIALVILLGGLLWVVLQQLIVTVAKRLIKSPSKEKPRADLQSQLVVNPPRTDRLKKTAPVKQSDVRDLQPSLSDQVYASSTPFRPPRATSVRSRPPTRGPVLDELERSILRTSTQRPSRAQKRTYPGSSHRLRSPSPPLLTSQRERFFHSFVNQAIIHSRRCPEFQEPPSPFLYNCVAVRHARNCSRFQEEQLKRKETERKAGITRRPL